LLKKGGVECYIVLLFFWLGGKAHRPLLKHTGFCTHESVSACQEMAYCLENKMFLCASKLALITVEDQQVIFRVSAALVFRRIE